MSRPLQTTLLWGFERYVRAQVAKHFATVRLAPGLEIGAAWDQSIPTLCVANHTNWWDGFLAFLVGRELGLTSYVLMDAVQLDRYPAFKLVGALPLHRAPWSAAHRDLLAARDCLEPGAALWMFPQGSRRPQAERPSALARGAAELALAHRAPLRICAVAFRYVYLSEQLPEAFAWLGRPWMLEPGRYSDRRALMPLLERDLLVALDALDAVLRTERLSGFATIVEGRLSINKRMDRLRHAVGFLRGRFDPRNG
jgi:1-acyl-sn-glycerol-3-phosphate acyltransferase